VNEEIKLLIFKRQSEPIQKYSHVSQCMICQVNLNQQDFEVLTFFDTYILLCQPCAHDIMNLVASRKIEREMKQHSDSSLCNESTMCKCESGSVSVGEKHDKA
jgi:hypothetical protein